MIFTELVLNNFGAYAGRHVINLRPENNGTMHPIVLFGGMNGGGKTTLMDAIRLALYGPRSKCSGRGNLGYGEFLNQLVNRQTLSEQNTEIELSFESIFDNHWQTFKVTRAWKRKPTDNKDSLSVIREDDYDRDLEENWDEYIESILPLGISNLFLFDGEQVKELAELDNPPATVVDAINSLLGLELSEKLSLDLDVLVNRKKKEIANKLQLATIEEIEAKLEEKRIAEKEAKEKLNIKIEEFKKAQKKKEKAIRKFQREGGKIAAEKDRLESEKKNFIQQKKQNREELRSLVTSVLPLGLINNLLSEAIATGKQEIEIQQIKQAKNIIDERDRNLLSYLEDFDPPQDYKTKIESFIKQENEQLETIIQSQENNILGVTEDELQQLINLQQNVLPLQQKQKTSLKNNLENIALELDSIEQKLAQAASPEEYEKLQKAQTNAFNLVSQLESDVNFTRNHKDKLTREVENTHRELKKYGQKVLEGDNSKHIVSSIAKVQETLKLFKEKLTLKKLNKLENEVTECFRYLLAKSNLVYRVVIDRETFKLSLYDSQAQPLPKQRLSAGEKQLLAIAFLWGLARVSGKKLPVAIDTPLGRLDSSHRYNLIERYFPSASHQVILLSTDTEIGEKEIVTLRQQNAIAREYLLTYNKEDANTSIDRGYFW